MRAYVEERPHLVVRATHDHYRVARESKGTEIQWLPPANVELLQRLEDRLGQPGYFHAGIEVPNDTLTQLETVGPLPLAKHERL